MNTNAKELIHLQQPIVTVSVADPIDDCADSIGSSMDFKENYQTNKTNMDSLGQKMAVKISQDISECNNAWMLYLQGLAGLCSAGARVSHSLQALAQGMPISATASHCRSAWDDMLRATQAATQAVRTEVASGLRDLAVAEESNLQNSEQIVAGNLATLINLQYQFCVACCECLGHIGAPDVNPQQQQSSPSAEMAGMRQQQIFSRLLGGQRRWSEVAARRTSDSREENGEEGAPRRWSVPWEGPGAGGAAQHQLAVPLVAHERSSRSTTPDSASLASQEELQEVISLLSCRPTMQLQPSSRHLPGVTLTNCSQSESMWPTNAPLFQRDNNIGGAGWYPSSSEMAPHGECPTRRGGSPRPLHHAAGSSSSGRVRSGWTPHEPLYTTIWGEQDGEQPGGQQLELFPPGQADPHYPRKSSSSTDSSSGSLQQHAGVPITPEQRPPSHLYSMWSGSEMGPSLPFIQLPSSPVQGGVQDSGPSLLP